MPDIKKPQFEFRPSLADIDEDIVQDEVFATNADIYIETLSDKCIFMSIKNETDDYDFKFFIDDDGELKLRAYK